MKNKALTVVLAASGLAFTLGVAPTHAAIQWDFSSGGTGGTGGRTYTSTGDAVIDVTVTAWSRPGSGTTLNSASLGSYGGGLGITNSNEGTGTPPMHAMDNEGSYDVMLFAFDTEVNLSNVTIGWNGDSNEYDEEISVLAWDGNAAQIPNAANIQNTTYTAVGAVAAGWDVIGSYDLGSDNTSSINAGAVSSSYWLIGAYNPDIGSCQGSGVCTAGTDTSTKDYMKLKTLLATASIPPPPSNVVAEPSTLMLLAFGLLAPAAYRRRGEKLVDA